MRPPWPRCNARPSPGLSTKTPKSAVVAPKTRTSRRRGRREGLGRLRARRCPARGFRSDRSAVRAACTSVLRQEVRENAPLLSFGPYSSTGGPLYRRQVASPTAHIDRDAVLTALRVGSNPSRNSDPDPWETALLRYVLPSRSSRKPARRERRQRVGPAVSVPCALETKWSCSAAVPGLPPNRPDSRSNHGLIVLETLAWAVVERPPAGKTPVMNHSQSGTQGKKKVRDGQQSRRWLRRKPRRWTPVLSTHCPLYRFVLSRPGSRVRRK